MAKYGLDFGNKVKFADKEYRDFSAGLDEKAVLGNLTWRRYEEAVQYTEDDTTKNPDRNGNYPQMPTGEIKWNDVQVHSDAQNGPLFISIVDMPAYAIEDLGLKLGDPVELEGVAITWSNVSGGVYKVFAKGIKKKGGQTPNQPKPQEQDKK